MLDLSRGRLLDVVEASYRPSTDWQVNVLNTVRDVVGERLTVASFGFESTPLNEGLRFDSIDRELAIGKELNLDEAIRQHFALAPPVVQALFSRTGAFTTSTQSGLAKVVEWPPWRLMWNAPVADALGLIVRAPSGSGMCICVGLHETTSLTPREQGLLSKIATHVGAGYRLHRASDVAPMDDAEAIMTPGGRVLHARAGAVGKGASLDEGRRRRDEARKTAHDVEKALEIWKGLIAGRWSLVDHFDTDGKRFLLAMKNPPVVDKRADLTPRERRACALVAMGHRDKEIAYMLGITTASVTASLHRARTKLGVKSRAHLAAAWRRPRHT